SLWLDASELDHLAPFLGLVDNQLAELGRRSRQRRAAEVSETGLHLRVVKSRGDLLVELVDDLGKRPPRANAVCRDPPPPAPEPIKDLVTDKLEGEADQDRRESREPRPLCRFPNGRGRHPAANVPGDSAAHRGTAAAAKR